VEYIVIIMIISRKIDYENSFHFHAFSGRELRLQLLRRLSGPPPAPSSTSSLLTLLLPLLIRDHVSDPKALAKWSSTVKY